MTLLRPEAIYNLAAKQLGVAPMRCVVVEDTAIGATAGKAANMKVDPPSTLGVSNVGGFSVKILSGVSKVPSILRSEISRISNVFQGFVCCFGRIFRLEMFNLKDGQVESRMTLSFKLALTCLELVFGSSSGMDVIF